MFNQCNDLQWDTGLGHCTNGPEAGGPRGQRAERPEAGVDPAGTEDGRGVVVALARAAARGGWSLVAGSGEPVWSSR